MTVNTAIEQLLEIESLRNEGIVTKDSLAVGMARLGQATQQVGIRYTTYSTRTPVSASVRLTQSETALTSAQ